MACLILLQSDCPAGILLAVARAAGETAPLMFTALFSQFWESLKIVAQPYWYPTELNGRAFGDVIISWGMSALILLSILATVGVEAFSSYIHLRSTTYVVLEPLEAPYVPSRMTISFVAGVLVAVSSPRQWLRR